MATLMIQLTTKLASLRSDERGQGLVEYSLILALVSVATIVLMRALAVDINDVFAYISTVLGGAIVPA